MVELQRPAPAPWPPVGRKRHRSGRLKDFTAAAQRKARQGGWKQLDHEPTPTVVFPDLECARALSVRRHLVRTCEQVAFKPQDKHPEIGSRGVVSELLPAILCAARIVVPQTGHWSGDR